MFFCIFLHKDEDVKTILNNLEFISFRIHNITFHLEFITSEVICHKKLGQLDFRASLVEQNIQSQKPHPGLLCEAISYAPALRMEI